MIWSLVASGCVRQQIESRPEIVSLTPHARWSCYETSKTRGSRQQLVGRLSAALQIHGTRPAFADTLPLRVVVGGAQAPRGAGNTAERASRLYMGVFGISDAKPDSIFPTWYTVTSGIYSGPKDLTPADSASLYKQGYRFVQAVLIAAKLDTLHCGT